MQKAANRTIDCFNKILSKLFTITFLLLFQFYLTKLKDELNDANNEYIQSVARCLQMMLRIDEYRIGKIFTA